MKLLLYNVTVICACIWCASRTVFWHSGQFCK